MSLSATSWFRSAWAPRDADAIRADLRVAGPGSVIHLIRVIPDRATGEEGDVAALYDRLRADAAERVEAFASPLEYRELGVVAHMVIGDPVDTVLEYANGLHDVLLVLVPDPIEDGLSPRPEARVMEEIVRRAACAMLLAR